MLGEEESQITVMQRIKGTNSSTYARKKTYLRAHDKTVFRVRMIIIERGEAPVGNQQFGRLTLAVYFESIVG